MSDSKPPFTCGRCRRRRPTWSLVREGGLRLCAMCRPAHGEFVPVRHHQKRAVIR